MDFPSGLSMSGKPPVEVKLGELVLIHLNTGDVIDGCVSEKTHNSIRLSDASFIEEDPVTGKEVARSSAAASFGLIDIPYANISTLQVLSVGPNPL